MPSYLDSYSELSVLSARYIHAGELPLAPAGTAAAGVAGGCMEAAAAAAGAPSSDPQVCSGSSLCVECVCGGDVCANASCVAAVGRLPCKQNWRGGSPCPAQLRVAQAHHAVWVAIPCSLPSQAATATRGHSGRAGRPSGRRSVWMRRCWRGTWARAWAPSNLSAKPRSEPESSRILPLCLLGVFPSGFAPPPAWPRLALRAGPLQPAAAKASASAACTPHFQINQEQLGILRPPSAPMMRL